MKEEEEKDEDAGGMDMRDNGARLHPRILRPDRIKVSLTEYLTFKDY